MPGRERRPLSSLLVGSWNQLAIARLQSGLERPGETNPIYIHGGRGLGKSCLLRGFATELRARHPGWEIVQIPGKRFVTTYQKSVYQKQIPEFRRRHQEADALVLDGVEALCAKPACQQELLSTLDILASRRRPIVFASSLAPRKLTEFLPQLASRFLAGVTATLHPPDAAALRTLVFRWGRDFTPSFPEDVLRQLADTFRGTPAELEKVLGHLSTARDTRRLALTPKVVQETVHLTRTGYADPDLDAIIAAVVEWFGVTRDDLTCERTTRRTTLARRVASYLATELTDLDQREIGAAIGKRRAATVRHARADIKKRIEEEDATVREAIEAIRRRLGV